MFLRMNRESDWKAKKGRRPKCPKIRFIEGPGVRGGPYRIRTGQRADRGQTEGGQRADRGRMGEVPIYNG